MIELPDYCECCGAFLQGGATIHKDDCFIKKLIEENFPTTECDFCSDPRPTWTFGCKSYEIPELRAESEGDWLACEDCAGLIHKGQWLELAERSCWKSAAGRILVKMAGAESAVKQVMEMHRDFRKHATGDSHRLEAS